MNLEPGIVAATIGSTIEEAQTRHLNEIQRKRLEILQQACAALAWAGDDVIEGWLLSPQSALSDRSPLVALRSGDYAAVLWSAQALSD